MRSWSSSRIKRIPQKKIENKGKGLTKFLIVLGILAGLGFYVLNSPLLKVGDITVTGVDQADSEEVYAYLLESVRTRKIYEVEKGYVTSLVNARFPNLKLNDIKYEFPNKFEVGLSEREEKYQILANNGMFIADDEGFVLGEATEASSSIDLDVIYDKSLEVGKKVEDISLQAALIYSDLNQDIKIENDQIHLELEGGGKVILPKNDAVSKVTEFYTLLQKIIQKYTIDNRQIEFIDLRFTKPVIKYL